MKKLFLISTVIIAAGLVSCTKDIEETNDDVTMNTKIVHREYSPVACILFNPVRFGVRCRSQNGGGCKTLTECTEVTSSFVSLAYSKFPGLNDHNWNEHPLFGDHDVSLALWSMDPSTFMHPDSLGQH